MSLRARLLLALLSTVLVVGIVASAATYLNARQEIDQIFDYQLRQHGLALRERAFPETARAIEPDPEQHIVIQVWDWRGTQTYRSQSFRAVAPPP